jgi:coenzyme PQQ precursor peptide PqqA
MRYYHILNMGDKSFTQSSPKETIMKKWLKPEIAESEAGMEVTSYLPAEFDRA